MEKFLHGFLLFSYTAILLAILWKLKARTEADDETLKNQLVRIVRRELETEGNKPYDY